MAGLCLSLIALSQGIAFFHAGDDMLRSKSLDRDSYNSGVACVVWHGVWHVWCVGDPNPTIHPGMPPRLLVLRLLEADR